VLSGLAKFVKMVRKLSPKYIIYKKTRHPGFEQIEATFGKSTYIFNIKDIKACLAQQNDSLEPSHLSIPLLFACRRRRRKC
jgi:hypothetical protein